MKSSNANFSNFENLEHYCLNDSDLAFVFGGGGNGIIKSIIANRNSKAKICLFANPHECDNHYDVVY